MEFFYLIPVALALGAAGLGAFMWTLRTGSVKYQSKVMTDRMTASTEGPGPPYQELTATANSSKGAAGVRKWNC